MSAPILQGRPVVDICEAVDQGKPKSRRQAALGIGERPRARPAHTLEGIDRPRPRAEPDQPIAAVGCRPQHHVGAPERREATRHMVGREVGNIAADDDRGPRRQAAEDAQHTLADIAPALLKVGQRERPEGLPPAPAGGRCREPCRPPCVPGKRRQHPAHQPPVEEPRLRVPDVAGEAPLRPAEPRLLEEDREVALSRLHP